MTKDELTMLQSLPLDLKILKTKQRISEYVYRFGENNVYISFSGGKDSTVLLDIVREDFPNVIAVFIDTGLEYPEIKDFVNTFSNVEIIKPKMSFNNVIAKYGYPLVSKEVSGNIYFGRKALERGDTEKYNHYINGHRHNKTTGLDYVFTPLPKKWISLFESDIPVSNRCCRIMKKDPARLYEKLSGKHPFVGEMAYDSLGRKTAYLRTGCNAFDGERVMSKPLGFWTEQDILQYIVDKKLEICSVYGKVTKHNNILETTGVSNSGCVWCCYGLHLQSEPNKFQQMKIMHPKLYEYCMRHLGYKDIFDFLDIKYE